MKNGEARLVVVLQFTKPQFPEASIKLTLLNHARSNYHSQVFGDVSRHPGSFHDADGTRRGSNRRGNCQLCGALYRPFRDPHQGVLNGPRSQQDPRWTIPVGQRPNAKYVCKTRFGVRLSLWCLRASRHWRKRGSANHVHWNDGESRCFGTIQQGKERINETQESTVTKVRAHSCHPNIIGRERVFGRCFY